MTKQEFKKIVKLLKDYYRDNSFSPVVQTVYWEKWKGYSYSTVYKAIMDAIENLDSYGRVPTLKQYEPFIEKYRLHSMPVKLSREVQTILDELEMAEKIPIPDEVAEWNVRSMNVLVKAILDKKNIGFKFSEAEFLSRYSEKLVALWLERVEIDSRISYSDFWRLSYDTFFEVIRRIHPELAQLVDEALALENGGVA